MDPISRLAKSDIGNLLSKPQRPNKRLRCFRSARIAHELKNCMTVLVLAVASFDRRADASVIAEPRRETFERALFEMNRLVDELVGLVQDGAPGETVERET